MQYSLILLSAGKGIRLGKSIPKQYLPLAGKPMIVHILERIDKIDDINEIIIACEEEYFDTLNEYIRRYTINKGILLIKGGKTRQESVFNGLKHASNDKIILHEAARPFVSVDDFKALIDCPHENVTYTYEIPYTVLKKDNNDYISDILNRQELVNIQLPQKFAKADLLQAHEQAMHENKTFTEDAGMLKYYINKDIYCLNGHSYNIKITEYTDLLLGELMIKEEVFKEQ